MPAREAELLGWFERLGLPMAVPLVGRNLLTALEFLGRRMPTLPDQTIEGFLRGIDLHKDVKIVWLQKGQSVAAFRRAGEPLFKLFYTKVGTGPERLGIVPQGRQFCRFTVEQPVEVLSARAADYIFASADDPVTGKSPWRWPGGGGGVQYVIPNAEHCLRTTPAPIRPSLSRVT